MSVPQQEEEELWEQFQVLLMDGQEQLNIPHPGRVQGGRENRGGVQTSFWRLILGYWKSTQEKNSFLF